MELVRIHLFMRLFSHMLQVDSIFPQQTTAYLLHKVAGQYKVLIQDSTLEDTVSPNLLELYGHHLEDFMVRKDVGENSLETIPEQSISSFSTHLNLLEEEIALKLNLSRIAHHKRDTIIHE